MVRFSQYLLVISPGTTADNVDVDRFKWSLLAQETAWLDVLMHRRTTGGGEEGAVLPLGVRGGCGSAPPPRVFMCLNNTKQI